MQEPQSNLDMVNSVIVFLSQRIPDCDFHSPVLLDLFISFDASICSTKASPPLENSDHVVVSVSIDFPSYSKRDASFHCIAYDYSCADWDGVHDHLRDVPWEDKFKLLLLLVNFVSGFRLEFMYISLTILGSGDSFVLLAYASLAASRTLLQQLLACLNFTLDSEDLFFWYKRK